MSEPAGPTRLAVTDAQRIGTLLPGETVESRRTRMIWCELVDYAALLWMQRPADKEWRAQQLADLAGMRGVTW